MKQIKEPKSSSFPGRINRTLSSSLTEKSVRAEKTFSRTRLLRAKAFIFSPLFTPASVPAKLEVYQSTSSGRSGRAVNETAALVVLITLTWGRPIMEMLPVCRGNAKHLTGGGGRRPRRCWRVGEATAVHRCSSTLSRCFTYPPSNWQMASDLR